MGYFKKNKRAKEKDLLRKNKEHSVLVLSTADTNIWLKLLGEHRYRELKEMNNSTLAIIQWQKGRLLKAAMCVLIGLIAAVGFKTWWVSLIGLALGVFIYISLARTIDSLYRQFKFERHLQFSKFTRLLVPYLKQKREGGNLYGVFAKIVKRLDHKEDKQLLMRLMQDMTENPNDIQPFLDYAQRTSGTDMSSMFMSTIYDIRKGSEDMDVISELDKLASAELMAGVDSIIQFKSKRFVMFPTKIAMLLFLLIIGLTVGILVREFSKMAGMGIF